MNEVNWNTAPLGEMYQASDGAEFSKKPSGYKGDLVELGVMVT